MAEYDGLGNQVGLFDQPPVARARRTDPVESHDAAKSVTDLTEKQTALLECLRSAGGLALTDNDLADLYRDNQRFHDYPEQSDSGLRTRRAELVKRGLVEKTGRTRLESGRLAAIWSVKTEDNQTEGADQ